MMKQLFTLALGIWLINNSSNAQCLDNWQYATPITVSNATNGDTLDGYQVILTVATDVLINSGKMDSTGADVRFSMNGCCNQLCYNIESGINTDTTTIAVKIPQILPYDSVTINMHYGNPNAVAADDPDCVYEFWDDFNANSFNTTKWENQGNLSVTQAGGTITFNGQSNWAYIRSTTQFTDMVLIRERRQALGVSAANVLGYTNTDNRYTFRQGNSNFMGTTYDNDVNGGNAFWNTNYPGIEHPNNVFYEYAIRATIESNTITVYDYCNTSTNNCNTTKTPVNQFTGASFYVGYSSYSPTYVGEADWVYVTKSVDTVPTVSYGIEAAVGLLSLGSDTSFCQGDSITLSPTGSWPAYAWSTTDTTPSITISSSGNYSVTVTNQIGCDVTDTIVVGVNPLPDATFSSTNIGSTYDFTNTENAGDTWAWDFGNGDTSSLQNPTYTYGIEGSYYVCLTVIDTNGCESTSCDSVNAAFPTGTMEISLQKAIAIYPNPANNNLSIDLSKYNQNAIIKVYSLIGELLFYNNLQASTTTQLNTSTLSNGHYLLKIESTKEVVTKRISIQH